MNRYRVLSLKETKLPFSSFKPETKTFSPTDKTKIFCSVLDCSATVIKAVAEISKAYMAQATEEKKSHYAFENEQLKNRIADVENTMKACEIILESSDATSEQKSTALAVLSFIASRGADHVYNR